MNLDWRVNAYRKQQDDEQRLPLEVYLDFIELMKIVENKQHWPWFREVLDIAERGDKGRAKNLKWMERVNQLRRIPAHPVQGRDFRMEDYEYLDWISREFAARIEAWRAKKRAAEE